MDANRLNLGLLSHPESKYQPIALLGRGGMADVILAVSRRPGGFNKLLVVKRLRLTIEEDAEEHIEMFLDEARLAARMTHPNIVHTYDVGSDDISYYIAMEYLEGQSLSRVLKAARGRNVHVATWVRIVADALLGLHYAHELQDFDGTALQIVHRDVSPSNIFVTFDGQVKLLDFGIAKATLNWTRTQVGMLKGTIGYMAPEQASSQPVDRRADIFSTGVILWEAIAGRRLLDSDIQTIPRRLTTDFPPIAQVRPDVDPKLSRIVERALRTSPATRFPNALEMSEALEDYLQGHPEAACRSEVGQLTAALFAHVRSKLREKIAQHLSGPVTEIDMHADWHAANQTHPPEDGVDYTPF